MSFCGYSRPKIGVRRSRSCYGKLLEKRALNGKGVPVVAVLANFRTTKNFERAFQKIYRRKRIKETRRLNRVEGNNKRCRKLIACGIKSR